MKKLNKHPRLYKKMANALKKLITNRIKLTRLKILNGQNKLSNPLKNNNNFIQQQIPYNKAQNNTNQNNNDFSRIINVASYRKIPYNDFILRLTPYDYETYLKMIKMNYSCRLEIHLTNIRPMKFILEVLLEKWKNIPKLEPTINLFLIPIRELWIPKELIFFSISDCDRIYDIGDIYTAYGSPSTNILHMKYQWNVDKLNLINNINNSKDILNRNNNSDSILNEYSESNIENNRKNISRLEASNLLNASHRTFYNNNQINFNSNKAIKGDESQDILDISGLDLGNNNNENENDNENENEEESDKKKSMNMTESIKYNEAYNNLLDKLSEQDSMFPLDTELLDPMELLGFDEDKKFDNLSNSTSNKIKTPSKSKKIHIRHKKINFVNNVKPTESMINSSFANANKNSNLKLRTGYSEVFSNNNSNNNININNLAYTSNNNISEVSSHINNSKKLINIKNDNEKQISFISQNNSNNKSQNIVFGKNNSENKEFKSFNINNNKNNSNIESDINLKMSNLTDPNNQNQLSQDKVRKKKKLKFIDNVPKENIKELKENSLSFFDKPDSKNNLSLNINFSFGQKSKEKEKQKEKEKEIKITSPTKNNNNNEGSQSPNSNKKKEIMNYNNNNMNWNYGLGTGYTRIIGNNSNMGYGFNDTNPFFGQNTLNGNGFFDNTNLFKSNINTTSNMFKLDTQTKYNNEDNNQLSQIMYINKIEERPVINQNININNSFIENNNDNVNNDKYGYLSKKRKSEEKPKKMRKNSINNQNQKKEKKNKKKENNNNINNYNYNQLKTPSFNTDYNNNLKYGLKGINNNMNTNNNNNFPYNIDIPLPSKFFEEFNNYKK